MPVSYGVGLLGERVHVFPTAMAVTIFTICVREREGGRGGGY